MRARGSRTVIALVGCLLFAGCSTATTTPVPSSAPTTASTVPTSTSSSPPSPDPTQGSQPVRFPASGSVQLAGRLFGSGPIGVVLAHQVDDDQSDWFPFAQRLASRGYRVLTFDLRGYCPGGGDGCSSGSPDVSSSADDVDAAMRFLAGKGVRTTILIGASVGGQAVLVRAARSQEGIAGVVSMSAPAFFAYDITAKTLGGLDVPTLFVAGTGDGEAAPSARHFARWVGGPTDLLVLDTGLHGVDLLSGTEPAIARTVDRRILEFLRRTASR
jgi:pimeloyl-ACP methyl ester carboxylesterase